MKICRVHIENESIEWEREMLLERTNRKEQLRAEL